MLRSMTTTIRVRNVPEAISRRLEARAIEAGMSLSDYLLAELTRFASIPTREEMRARLRSRPRVKVTESVAKMVRRERDPRHRSRTSLPSKS